jgi:hypothetical protein
MFSILLGEFGCLFTQYSICSMFSLSSTWFAAYFVHYVERWFAAFLLTLWRHAHTEDEAIANRSYAISHVPWIVSIRYSHLVHNFSWIDFRLKQCIIILIKIAEQNRGVKRCGLLTVCSIWLSGFETWRFFHLLQVHFQNSFEHFWVQYVYGSVMFSKKVVNL